MNFGGASKLGGGFGTTTGFGAAAPAFGAATTGFGGGGAFGQTTTAPAATGGGLFQGGGGGNTFGGGNSFGAKPATAFGVTSGGGNMFGGQQAATTGFAPAANTFGQTATTGAFGGANGGGFGGGTQSPFGKAATTGGFGATGQTTFGATGFGAAAPAAGGFGQAATVGGFGQQQQSFGGGLGTANSFVGGGAFGSIAKPASPFGQTTTGGFGSSQITATVGFGGFGNTPAAPAATGFGGAATTPFGQAATTITGFGGAGGGGAFGTQSMGGFGGASSLAQVGQGGTGNPPFRPAHIHEPKSGGGSTTLNLYAITGMDAYKDKSFEELHLEDVMKGNRGPPTGGAVGIGMGGGIMGGGGFNSLSPAKPLFGSAAAPSTFGAPAAQTTFGGGLGGGFGAAAPATTTGFGGSTGGGMFGGAPAANTGFGALGGTTGGMFGSTATTTSSSVFPSTNTGSAFGAAKPAFGAAPTTVSSPFGTTFNAGGLGVGTSTFGGGGTGAFGSHTGGLSFGQNKATTPAFGGAMGSTTPGFSSNMFNPATPSLGTPAFGSTGAAPAFSSTFGSPKPMGGFGSATTTPSFGNFQANTGGMSQFGIPQQQQMQQQQQQQISIPTTPTVDQKIDLLLKKKGDLAQKAKKEESEIQQSITSPSIILAGLDIGRSKQITRSAPLSSAKLLSRSSSKKNGSNYYNDLSSRNGSSYFNNGNDGNNMMSSAPGTAQKGGMSVDTSNNPLTSPAPHLGSAKKLIISTYLTPSQQNSVNDLPPPPPTLFSLGGGSTNKNSNSTSMMMMAPAPATVDRSASRGRDASAAAIVVSSSDDQHQPQTGLTPNQQGTPFLDLSMATKRGGAKILNTDDMLDKERKDLFPSPARQQRNNQRDREQEQREQQQRQKSSSYPPHFTKSDYKITPDLRILSTLTDDELSSVEKFSISRPGYGKIEWLQPIDLRNEDLDKAVVIDRLAVAVYEDCEHVPNVGDKLNNPAEITLEEALPKSRDDTAFEAYEKKLKSYCVKNDAEFISYDRVRGLWKFRVKHFSRYGLDEDDDDKDNTAPQQQQEQGEPEQKSSDRMDVVRVSFDPAVLASAPDTSSNKTPRYSTIVGGEATSSIKQLKRILFKETSPMPMTVTAMTASSLSNKSQQHSNVVSSTRVATAITMPATPYFHQDIPSKDYNTNFIAPAHKKPRIPLFEQEIAYDMKYRQRFLELTPIGKKAFFLHHESPTIQALLAMKAKLLGITSNGIGSTTKSLELQTRSKSKMEKKDLLLFMGRSFRVGWSKDGRIIHSGRLMAAKDDKDLGHFHRIAIEPVSSFTWQENRFGSNIVSSKSLIEPLMNELSLSSAPSNRSEPAGMSAEMKLPLWQMPRLLPNDLSQYNGCIGCLRSLSAIFHRQFLPRNHPDWTLSHAVGLLEAVLGQEKIISDELRDIDYLPLAEDRSLAPEHWERRRVWICRWFAGLTKDLLTPSIEKSDAYEQAFEFLAAGQQIDKAVEVLEVAGAFRMALLVSQAGSESSTVFLLRRQLELWQAMGAFQLIPPAVLKLYTLLAGELSPIMTEESDVSDNSILRGLGWMRGLAMLLWYYPGQGDQIASLTFALKRFLDLRLVDCVDAPDSPFVNETGRLGAKVDSPIVKNGLFSLLLLLFPQQQQTSGAIVDDATENMIIAALMPEGYTCDELDLHCSYLIVVLLEAIGVLQQPGQKQAMLIRQQFIEQLLTMGLWKWALFVALQLPDDRDSSANGLTLVQDILRRWAVNLQPEDGVFIVDRLGIPREMLHAAMACAAGYYRDYDEQLKQFCYARMPRHAARVLCLSILPALFIQAKDNHEKQQQLLQPSKWLYVIEYNILSLVPNAAMEDLTVDGLWMELLGILQGYFEVRDAAAHAQRDGALEAGIEIAASSHGLLLRLAEINNKANNTSGSRSWLLEDEKVLGMLHSIGSYLYDILAEVELQSEGLGAAEMRIFGAALLRNAPVERRHMAKAVDRAVDCFLFGAASTMVL